MSDRDMKSTIEILREVHERIEDARLAVRQALDGLDAGWSTVGILHEAHERIEDVRLVVEQTLERLDAPRSGR